MQPHTKKIIGMVLICTVLYGAYRLYKKKNENSDTVDKKQTDNILPVPAVTINVDDIANGELPKGDSPKDNFASIDGNIENEVSPTPTSMAFDYLISKGHDAKKINKNPEMVIITMAYKEGWDGKEISVKEKI